MMSLFRVVPVVSEEVYRYGVYMIFIYFVNLSTELCVSTACVSVGVWVVCTIRIQTNVRIVITELRIN